MIICIVDTSILCELLKVPRRFTDQHADLLLEFERRQKAGERFLLPLTVVLETGNHIANAPDGTERRRAAEKFVTLVRQSLAGESPFDPAALPGVEDVQSWLDDFVDHAMCGRGLGDRSLIALWQQLSELHPHGRVYIWSLDGDLQGYDTIDKW
jgi:hypothetical protein